MSDRYPALHSFRHRLADAEALPQLALLGIISGLVTGSLIIAFRLLATLPLSSWYWEAETDYIARLSWEFRLTLPLLGTLLIAWFFTRLQPHQRQVGVPHVMERLATHQGRLPAMNLIAQFLGALTAIVSGNSVGREGPSIHLGGASSSLFGQWLKLPNNSLRTLTGCGCAAAVAAGFNTPIAAVILTMEVIMLEYSFSSLIPVILASVTGAILSSLVFGQSPAFDVPILHFTHTQELPLVFMLGIITGLLAFLFCYLVLKIQRFPSQSLFVRLGIAGLLTGIIAVAVPQVLGIGYESVDQILRGELPLEYIALILVGKLIATTTSVGMGMPGGLIGPTLVMGVATGAITGMVAEHYFQLESGSNFYALLGMGSMLAAVLQAPLAALLTMLELTRNPHIVMPALLTIITATLLCRQLSGQPGIFASLLQLKGHNTDTSPLAQSLQRVGVASLMQGNISTVKRFSSSALCRQIIAEKPRWILVSERAHIKQIIPAADLEKFLDEQCLPGDGQDTCPDTGTSLIDLISIPGDHYETGTIDVSATLLEAHRMMQQNCTDILCVTMQSKTGIRVRGVITRQSLEAYYH
ncbi:chloride channel protein [Endozoicomonadaceae bacterium StTr2]